MLWVPGALQLLATSDGGPQDTSYPPRLVLHTTEGNGTVQDLYSFYKNVTGFWPHFTADITRHVLAQHIPFNRGGRALTHTDSTQTNDANCLQVEIIGFANQSPQWAKGDIEWLGRALAPAMDALGIHRIAPRFVAGGAGLSAPQRMSEGSWRIFNGVCGHEHVPENDHYDPGAMDINTFLTATGGSPGPVPVPVSGGEMIIAANPAGQGYIFVDPKGHVDAFGVQYHGGQDAWLKSGLVVPPHTLGASQVSIVGVVTGVAMSHTGSGYFIVSEAAAAGKTYLYTFGDAKYLGVPK